MTAYGCRLLLLAALSIAACGLFVPAARAVTPDSPEVRKVIDKAFEFLATADDGRVGGKCLIGLTFLKDGKDETHPKIAAAVQSCQNLAKGDAAAINADIYSTGIAIIFLCSLDPSKYSAEILKLSESLQRRQKSHGGWGYADKQTGDTSMTQYAVLAYWEMSKVGFNPSLESTERVGNWLLRTQDPGGHWGYQGKEAEGRVSYDLVKQDSARPGMAAAGLGATYMVADLLGLGETTVQVDATLPPALRPLARGQAQQARTRKVDARKIRAAQERGRDWMRKNYAIETEYFGYYYLYALERYQSFLEASEGRTAKEPRWYNEGFSYLKKEQEENGSWKDSHEGLEAVNTAFATLFLLRSTKKAIERSKTFGEGALLAGRGLPEDPQAVRIRGAQIVSKKLDLSVGELIDVLFQPEHDSFAAAAADIDYLRDELLALKAEERAPHLARLRTLAASGVGDARLTAVKVLGQLRDLESGEALIHALDDSDWRVVLAADESLRLIGRSVTPTSLGEKPEEKARAAASAKWKQWYVTIRPDVQFEK
jgi:hypothetical protein